MQNNPEIEQIVENSMKLARERQHRYVLTEHLMLSLLRHQPFSAVLEKFGADVAAMTQDVENYLASLSNLASPGNDVAPRKTNALERVFNRALTQVLFTGRRTMTTADLFLAMMSETNSHAHYFFLKYGVTKQDFVGFWEKNYNHNGHKITDQQAQEILEEYCVNLTEQ
jgi:ATP-dependent Clp protease ATP-binding subunit ClpA